MYALLAFKRPSLIEGRYQLAFEIRNFGCFNGFNTDSAFTTNPMTNVSSRFDVVFDNVLENGRLPDNYFFGGRPSEGMRALVRPANQLDFSHVSVLGHDDNGLLTSMREEGRPWECIAIGYMAYAVGNCFLNYQPPAVPNPTGGALINPEWTGVFAPNQTFRMNSRIMSLVNRNRIDETYYDHYTGDTMTSQRQATPNEGFLRNFLQSMAPENIPVSVKYSLKSSRMIIAICYAQDYMHGTFDLVGSERPSGLAVSYLQVYRNVCEKQWAGMETPADKASSDCLLTMAQSWTRSLDPIPLISTMCNNGDDSDIIAFTGNRFIMYATKIGLFNCANFYRRSDSMLVEGRYNKGGQSEFIKTEMRQKVEARGGSVAEAFEAASEKLQKLQVYSQHLKLQPNIQILASAIKHYSETLPESQKAALNAAKARTLAQSVIDWLEVYASFNIQNILSDIRGSATALTNFRFRPSNIQLAPNPMAFKAWVLQAEGAITGPAEGTEVSQSAEIPEGIQEELAGGPATTVGLGLIEDEGSAPLPDDVQTELRNTRQGEVIGRQVRANRITRENRTLLFAELYGAGPTGFLQHPAAAEVQRNGQS